MRVISNTISAMGVNSGSVIGGEDITRDFDCLVVDLIMTIKSAIIKGDGSEQVLKI